MLPLWFAIFTAQPHKEERFLFPVYPLVALSAAVSLHCLASCQTSIFKVLKYPILLSFIVLSLSRTVAIVKNYHAPLDVYKKLYESTPPIENLCVAHDWYRFPSHYFLPAQTDLRFLQTTFDGALPKYFQGTGRNATARNSRGFNDLNIEEEDQYFREPQACSVVVGLQSLDAYFVDRGMDVRNPNVWDQSCSSFLDASKSGLLGRVWWAPVFVQTAVERLLKWCGVSEGRVARVVGSVWDSYCSWRRM